MTEKWETLLASLNIVRYAGSQRWSEADLKVFGERANLRLPRELEKIFTESDIDGEKWSAADLAAFEKNNNLVLPIEYKDYCQVIGSGGFLSYSSPYIHGPNLKFSKIAMLSLIDDVSYRQSMKMHGAKKTISSQAIARNIFESALVFGYNDLGMNFFFDLSSYRQSDHSCDIFIADSDSCGDVYSRRMRSRPRYDTNAANLDSMLHQQPFVGRDG